MRQSVVRIEPSPSVWQAAPPDFVLVETTSTVRIQADLVPTIETYQKPLRVVRPNALLIGREVFQRFRDEVPAGLRLDPSAMSGLLRRTPGVEIGLIAIEDTRGSSPADPAFYHCWGQLTGVPPGDTDITPYVGQKEQLASGPALWVLVEELLGDHGFKSADLGIFAASPAVAPALAKAALTVVQARHLDLPARAFADLQAKMAGKLTGWDSASYSAPNAMSLWDEAIAEAFANSRPEKLPALVKALGPRAPAEPAGGAQ